MLAIFYWPCLPPPFLCPSLFCSMSQERQRMGGIGRARGERGISFLLPRCFCLTPCLKLWLSSLPWLLLREATKISVP